MKLGVSDYLKKPLQKLPERLTSPQFMALERQKAAHNYNPLPVVVSRAEGVYFWDAEGVKYYDFLSAYSAVNQGHCHPKILHALNSQAQRCTLTSRAFYNDVFPVFAEYITNLFSYDMVLPMNTGVEAVETSLKVARKWAYKSKGVAENEAIVVNCTGCFHGRSITAISMSSDPSSYMGFGPLLPGFLKIPYGDSDALAGVLEEYGNRVAAFLVEPIQGEAGVVVPPDGYLKLCYDLCKKHDVLFLADEVQTGLGRTGKMSACEYENVRPDILILGKALGGGVLPVSCILADRDVMMVIRENEHGSTFGGNPLSSSVALASLEVLIEEDLPEMSYQLGLKFRKNLSELSKKHNIMKGFRGRGLMNAIIVGDESDNLAYNLCIRLKNNGLLAKPTHGNIIRMSPPLIITERQLEECIEIIDESMSQVISN